MRSAEEVINNLEYFLKLIRKLIKVDRMFCDQKVNDLFMNFIRYLSKEFVINYLQEILRRQGVEDLSNRLLIIGKYRDKLLKYDPTLPPDIRLELVCAINKMELELFDSLFILNKKRRVLFLG